jgi:hypothetical protein
MMESQQHANLRDKVRNELREFLIITLFFTLVLGAFNIYRREILGEAGVSYYKLGISLVEAMILAKIVLIGEALNLKLVDAARRSIFEVAVMRSILFAVLVALFTILERVADGLIHRMDWTGIARLIVEHGLNEIVARVIMMFAAFLPFFAFWELRRRLGPRRFFELWFARTDSASSGDESL